MEGVGGYDNVKFANHTRDFKKEKTKKRERKILITRSLLYNYSYSLYFNVILIKKFEFRFFFFGQNRREVSNEYFAIRKFSVR